MASEGQYKNMSLCWLCRHAVPKIVEDKRTGEKRYVRGCPWSIYKQPVPGWDADKSKMTGHNAVKVVTYFVRKCPLFERGRK